MARTKIVVVQLKEIIYTVIFAALGVLLILLLIYMFSANNKKDVTSKNDFYTPGVWTSTFKLNDTSLNLEVIAEKDRITSIRLVNLDEAIATMYPLMQPSLDAIALQLYNDVPLEEITLLEDSSYTQTYLINEIRGVLEKAKSVEQ
ncbi:MAG TPA: hypothetical protein GXZ90_08095 [Clostridiales bacterium]|nr:hypothetical protein [Clostridiales bacterium]